MAELIKVVKPKKYNEAFISIDKNAFIELCSKTSKKNVIILYILLAGNSDGWGIWMTENNVMKLWGVDKNLANALTRSDNKGALKDLKDLNYINEKGEFNEYGWGEDEKELVPEISSQDLPPKVIVYKKKEAKEEQPPALEKHDIVELMTEDIIKKIEEKGF